MTTITQRSWGYKQMIDRTDAQLDELAMILGALENAHEKICRSVIQDEHIIDDETYVLFEKCAERIQKTSSYMNQLSTKIGMAVTLQLLLRSREQEKLRKKLMDNSRKK